MTNTFFLLVVKRKPEELKSDNDFSFPSDVLRRLKKIKPSAFSSSWSSIQGVQPVLLNHRPAQAYDIPIYLYHPIFSDFMALCESCQVDVQDEKFAVDISVKMCEAFDNEDKRKKAFIDLMRNYLSDYSFKIGAYESDGHIMVTVKGEDIILAILEVKPEFGKGHGCAFVQATAYYSQHVVDASENQLKYYQKTCCPVFILYLAGPFLGFAGAICTDLPICDPLGPVIPLFYLPNEYPTMLRMAQTFKTFKQSIHNLHKSYLEKLSGSDNHVRQAAVFPYVQDFHSLGSSSSPRSFTYIQRLTDKRPLYVARLSDTADHLVFVKFTMQYGLEAHVAAAEKGFAPALLGVDKLDRGWKLVVMEYLPDNKWRMLTDVDDKAGARDNVVTVMNSFHELGYVHGDLRGENIMIADDGQVKIIDFDWAGLAGQVRYPHFMNPQIQWHINAQPDELIQTEHDVYLLNSYFI